VATVEIHIYNCTTIGSNSRVADESYKYNIHCNRMMKRLELGKND
jgi:hypothetical protein